jgi:hypothetical protein
MFKTILLAAVVCVAFLIPASAQTLNLMRVTLPFSAIVGGITLPAGDYTVQDLRDDGNSSIFLIRSATGKAVDIMGTRLSENGANTAAQSQLVFKHAAGQYQIDRIWFYGREYSFYPLPRKPAC